MDNGTYITFWIPNTIGTIDCSDMQSITNSTIHTGAAVLLAF